MTKTRREFLAETSLGLVGAAVAGAQQQKPGEPPAGTPPAFGTGPAVGPEVSAGTFAEAEKVVQQSGDEPRGPRDGGCKAGGAATWRRCTSGERARIKWRSRRKWRRTRTGIRSCRDRSEGLPERERFVRSSNDAGDLCPGWDEDIAFAPVWKLSSAWIETRKITSERLTKIYLERLERFNGKLRCA